MSDGITPQDVSSFLSRLAKPGKVGKKWYKDQPGKKPDRRTDPFDPSNLERGEDDWDRDELDREDELHSETKDEEIDALDQDDQNQLDDHSGDEDVPVDAEAGTDDQKRADALMKRLSGFGRSRRRKAMKGPADDTDLGDEENQPVDEASDMEDDDIPETPGNEENDEGPRKKEGKPGSKNLRKSQAKSRAALAKSKRCKGTRCR